MKLLVTAVLALALTTGAQQASHFDGKTWWDYVKVLADDNMEGRETGSAGLRKAQAFVVDQLKKSGLQPAGSNGFYQPIKFVSRQVVEGYVQRSGNDAAPEVLTARQREVLRLVAGGKSTKEIAFLLNLSVKTVETHRAQIMERLGIRDVAGLVRYALRTGLVPPDG